MKNLTMIEMKKMKEEIESLQHTLELSVKQKFYELHDSVSEDNDHARSDLDDLHLFFSEELRKI